MAVDSEDDWGGNLLVVNCKCFVVVDAVLEYSVPSPFIRVDAIGVSLGALEVDVVSFVCDDQRVSSPTSPVPERDTRVEMDRDSMVATDSGKACCYLCVTSMKVASSTLTTA